MTMQKYHLEMVKDGNLTYQEKVSSPTEVAKMLRDVLKMDVQAEEIFVTICLDTKNKVIGLFEVSHGNMNASLVHPREVFKRALLCNAACIIIAHNHPSGETTPSREDINITGRLKEAGELLGVPVIDHIIIGEAPAYYSFKEENTL